MTEPGCAFRSRRKAEHVSTGLIVRRARCLNSSTTRGGQDELLADYRHHAVFKDSPLAMIEAEASHRNNATTE